MLETVGFGFWDAIMTSEDFIDVIFMLQNRPGEFVGCHFPFDGY